MPGGSHRRAARAARRTDAEVLAILTAKQHAAHAQRTAAGQHVGCHAPLGWGYRGLAAIADESDSSARRRAQRMVAAGVLERLPGHPVMFRLARAPTGC